jgi:hypothetical protein
VTYDGEILYIKNIKSTDFQFQLQAMNRNNARTEASLNCLPEKLPTLFASLTG